MGTYKKIDSKVYLLGEVYDTNTAICGLMKAGAEYFFEFYPYSHNIA